MIKFIENQFFNEANNISSAMYVKKRTELLLASVHTIIAGIEKYIKNPYSPEGFYTIFTSTCSVGRKR